MTSEMEALLRTASYAAANVASLDALRSTAVGERDSGAETPQAIATATDARGSGDVSSLATEINRLVEATRAAAAVNVAPPKMSQVVSSGSESSTGETILRTAAMMTGVGPMVTGLIKLFGSSEPEPLPALEKFEAPSSVSVEAGLSSSREFGGIRYGQGGLADITGGSQSATSQAPTIQVNIQAMDSQSFLDRQEDIARAVREAMLHSNSLNDVVLEL
jgi:hypothetical protein